MIKEEKAQTKVQVGLDALWRCVWKDLWIVTPKIVPNLVKDSKITEGDGGLGTVFLFTFGPDVPNMSYQKEKIVELDESLHQMGLQVIEGGHLNLGLSSYTVTYQLTEMGESETLVDIKVVYETEKEECVHMPEKTIKSVLAFVKCLETFLLSQSF